MKIKTELLKKYIGDYINIRINDFDINATEIADTTAIKALAEIQQIIKDIDLSDFDMADKIVCVFEKYKLDAGSCHDFY